MAVEIEEQVGEFGGLDVHIRDYDKSKTTYIVAKEPNGFSFFHVRIDKGNLPKELSSSYISQSDCEKVVLNYLESMRPSATVRRDANTKAREEQKKRLKNG